MSLSTVSRHDSPDLERCLLSPRCSSGPISLLRRSSAPRVALFVSLDLLEFSRRRARAPGTWLGAPGATGSPLLLRLSPLSPLPSLRPLARSRPPDLAPSRGALRPPRPPGSPLVSLRSLGSRRRPWLGADSLHEAPPAPAFSCAAPRPLAWLSSSLWLCSSSPVAVLELRGLQALPPLCSRLSSLLGPEEFLAPSGPALRSSAFGGLRRAGAGDLVDSRREGSGAEALCGSLAPLSRLRRLWQALPPLLPSGSLCVLISTVLWGSWRSSALGLCRCPSRRSRGLGALSVTPSSLEGPRRSVCASAARLDGPTSRALSAGSPGARGSSARWLCPLRAPVAGVCLTGQAYARAPPQGCDAWRCSPRRLQSSVRGGCSGPDRVCLQIQPARCLFVFPPCAVERLYRA